jgi:hypothetical protein
MQNTDVQFFNWDDIPNILACNIQIWLPPQLPFVNLLQVHFLFFQFRAWTQRLKSIFVISRWLQIYTYIQVLKVHMTRIYLLTLLHGRIIKLSCKLLRWDLFFNMIWKHIFASKLRHNDDTGFFLGQTQPIQGKYLPKSKQRIYF